MSKTAILVDGGFYRKRARFLWGEHSPQKEADALFTYCLSHLQERQQKHDLYRIFYYDCPPIDKQMYHPMYGRTINMALSKDSLWMRDFLSYLRKKRKLALRLGKLDVGNAAYTLEYDAVKKLFAGSLTIGMLNEHHFYPTIRQKGVDMKLGIDIASLAYKSQVDQIVLISGDSDFVPAAKLARREGIDLVLDTMYMSIGKDSDLFEHVDGVRSCANPHIKTKQAGVQNAD